MLYTNNALLPTITLDRMEHQYQVTEGDLLEPFEETTTNIQEQPQQHDAIPSYTPQMAALSQKTTPQKKVLVERGTNIEDTLSKEIRMALASRQRGKRCRSCRR